jgi:hypothetical protein
MMATTKPTQRSITEDYVRAFDGMRSYQKMRLGYIYGCVVVGFTCDGVREPRVYKPTFHLHNLAKPSPTVSLAAAHTYRPRSVPFTVAFDRHDESLTQMVEYFSDSCPLVYATNRSMDLVLAHHSAHLESLRGTVLFPNILEHEIPIYELAYFGDIDGALKLAERTSDLLASAPEEQVYRFSGESKKGWFDQLACDFQRIHDSVATSIAELKLTTLEHYKGEQGVTPNA